MRSAVQSLGLLGLPVPIRELAAQRWDALIVGAGHNGLTCAAYLARAGKRVLVLETRERVGGACTIEQPFPETHPAVRMSPCAYLAGLLHPKIIEELNLPARGFHWPPPARFPRPPRRKRPLRPHARRFQHPAMGRRSGLRGRSPSLRASRCRRLA